MKLVPVDDTPLLSSPKRTGTVWTAVAHIITGVIGSGVLSLAWSTAQLGWIAGPLVIVFFSTITLLSTFLLCDCYRSPDPELGPVRNRSYHEAADTSLGTTSAWICGLFVQITLYGFGIAYTVTSGISMRAILKANCYHDKGHDAPCSYSDTSYMLIFGVIELILSQIPNFHDIQWLSILAAFMSFAYAFIGFGLGLAKVLANGVVKGTIVGVTTATPAQKVWLIAQAIGDIAFAYPYSFILIEIQDTLKSPPSETQTMKRASTIALVVTTTFYLVCGGFGYAAFGDATPGNLLTGFGFYEPYWLVDFANVCIVLHLIGGYQVYSQPLFANVEKWLSQKFANNEFLRSNYNLELPVVPAFRFNVQRLLFRTLYVASTTVIAIIFPYFNEILGVLGGLNFWPLTIYFPVEMYFRQRDIRPWSVKWVLLKTYTIVCFLITTFALVGSIQGLIQAKLH